jgi:glycosyltransferase involved in cell wall biosynthesis
MTAASVCVSEGLREYVVDRWHGAGDKSRRIYNPVDPGPATPAASEAELLARGPVALAAGRMVNYKGFSHLIRAFAKVEPANARLVILGEGEERPKIEAEIARLGLGDRVTLAGYVRQPWTYYQQAACFVLPSDSEPFGLVVVEALGNGLSVVSTNCDGPREILANGAYGSIVAKGDEDSLAAAISRSLAAPGDPLPRIERAKQFSLERGLDEYEKLIGDVLRAGPINDRRAASRRDYATTLGAS